MKKTLFTIICLLLIPLSVFSNKALLEPIADSPFDSYRSDISWTREKYRLDNFAIFLKRNPEMIGYIAFYVGEKDSLKKANLRIRRALKYLTQDLPPKWRIDKTRIVVIYAGNFDDSRTVLQPQKKGLPPPPYKRDVETNNSSLVSN